MINIIYEVVATEEETHQGHIGTKWIYGVGRFGLKLYEYRNDKMHYVCFNNAHELIDENVPINQFTYCGFTFKLV